MNNVNQQHICKKCKSTNLKWGIGFRRKIFAGQSKYVPIYYLTCEECEEHVEVWELQEVTKYLQSIIDSNNNLEKKTND
jgi:RNase P subunit RPR2